MKSSYILVIFAVICFIFAAIFSADVSKVEQETLSVEGGIYGPLAVKEKNAVYKISLSNYVDLNQWSYIVVDVLDANKEYLFSFGDEMWHERGFDSDGPWTESKTGYSMNVTFKEPGEYYFEVSAERSNGEGHIIGISVVKERGSNVAFLSLGSIGLMLGGLVFYFGRVTKFTSKKSVTGRVILVFILIVVLIVAFLYSMRGWGYMGYNGYHHGPSFLYFGGASVFHQASNRDGSISGSGHRGGGFSAGK